MLTSLHRLLDSAHGYDFSQLFGVPTLRAYRALVCENIPRNPQTRILEIGCGLGWARELFPENYTGIDINPDYIRAARAKFSGQFHAMDAAQMPFAPGSFDEAVTIATTHHLTDEQLQAMVAKAVEVAARLHIIDAILPVSPRSWFKNALFRMDRGRFPRSVDRLRDAVSQIARVELRRVREGPLHDVCYIRASQPGNEVSKPLPRHRPPD